MKKLFRTLFVTAALCICMAIPAFAATEKQDYQLQATEIRAQICDLNSQITELRSENFAISADFMKARQERKGESADEKKGENWQHILELRKEIRELNTAEKTDSEETETVRSLNAAAKTAAQSGNYDEALASLNKIIDLRKERLSEVTEKNKLWKQLDAVLK